MMRESIDLSIKAEQLAELINMFFKEYLTENITNRTK